jgi:hypothetical protein
MFLSLFDDCGSSAEREVDELADEAVIDGPPAFWALVHRTDAPETGPGVYRVDLAEGAVDGPLPLPDELSSPHALFDDGAGLLVGGYVDGPSYGAPPPDQAAVFRLDYDGALLDEYVQFSTEGITGDGASLYVAGPEGEVEERDADWSPGVRVETGSQGLSDVAVHGRTLYTLTNDSGDTIRAFDLDDPDAEPRVVTERATYDNTGYAMMAWDGHLVVGDSRDGRDPFLRHLDHETGASLGITWLTLEGWITAIALPAE